MHQNDPDYQILFLKGHIPVRTVNGKQEAYGNREEIPAKDYEKEIALVNIHTYTYKNYASFNYTTNKLCLSYLHM